MIFKDMGRMVLEVTITSRLGDRVGEYDIAGLVKGYVEQFGFVDLGTIEPADFEALADRHKLN